MITIDKLNNEFKNKSANSEQIKKIKKNLVDDLQRINEDTTEVLIANIVKNVKSDDKNWKFNSWNIPDGIKKKDGEHAWNKEFTKKFIRVCVDISNVNAFEEVLKICHDSFDDVENTDAGVSAFSISAILHCIKPNYIPILSNKEYYNDIYNICLNNTKDSGKPSNKDRIKNLAANIEKIYKYCSDNKLLASKDGSGFDFTLIDDALLTLAENNGGVAENESTTEYDGVNAMNEDINIEFDKNMILFGPPGTGKTYNTVIYAVAICDGLKENDTDNEKIKKVKEILVKHFVGESNITKEENKKLPASKEILGNHFGGKSNITKGEYEELLARYNTLKDPKKSGRIAFTTFHQSYGYEEFIEGIKPVMENGQNSADSNANEDAKETNNEADNKSKDVKYEIKSGVFKSFCDVAKKDPDNSYVFIIDEINRGNISKIFGELITLIEPTKRTGEAEAMEAILPYSNEPFGVPKNVYIIGTMNTADRSIALMDTALRRRFQFVEMLPDPEVLEDDKDNDIIIVSKNKNGNLIEVNVKTLLTKINERIEYLYDREHTIGHAFFTCLLNEEKRNVKELGKIFEKSVIPLLQEYFYDDYKKIMLVLGYDPEPKDKNTNQNNDQHDQLIIAKKLEKKDIFGDINFDIDIPEYSYEIDKDAFKNIESYMKICNRNQYKSITETSVDVETKENQSDNN